MADNITPTLRKFCYGAVGAIAGGLLGTKIGVVECQVFQNSDGTFEKDLQKVLGHETG
jgi:hypothetical protein